MQRNSATIEIVNVVASATLKHEVDLNVVVKAFPSVEYREQFPGLVFRLKRPRTATLIFHSGKMVCTGAKSERGAIRALKRIVRKLRKAGVIILGKPEIKIVNIVASASFGGPVDLLGLYMSERDRGGGIMYEPEQFPGLIYRMENPHAVMLIFASGKLVCTGAKKEEDVRQAVNKLRRKLEDEKVIHYEESAMPLMQLRSK